MTKQCPQCNRDLELNEINFRKFNGSWRNKCRDCQNSWKRYVYKNKKRYEKKMQELNLSIDRKMSQFAEKYSQIFALEERHGILSEKAYISLVLASRGNSKAVNGLISEIIVDEVKQQRQNNIDSAIEKYDRIFAILKKLGLNTDMIAECIDKAVKGLSESDLQSPLIQSA